MEDGSGGRSFDTYCAAHSAAGNSDYAPHSATAVTHSAAEGSGPPVQPQPARQNRRWSAREKAQITAESFEPGATISAVARRHGLSLGLLHYWRRKVRDSGRVEEMTFVPVAVEDAVPAAVPVLPDGRAGIEIEAGGVRVHLLVGVDMLTLRTVLSALRAG